jgi:site-specific DNA recombinase
VDEGYSGATLVRPGLERLRDQIADGTIDVLYVHSPDRLARRYAYQVLLLEEFGARSVEVFFVLGPAGRSAEDALLVQVQGMIAEYERAKSMERCRRGKLHKAKQGVVNPLSGAPYGYLYVRASEVEPARYEVVPDEAAVVRSLFEGLVHEQKSIGQLVRDLNARKVPTRRGAARWDRSTVWAMLRNPAYRGQAAYGKTESIERAVPLRTIKGRSATPRHAKSTHRARPPEKWVSIPVPALVASVMFDAAGEQLARNQRLAARNARGRRYLLQGLLVCARCRYAYYDKLVSTHAAKRGSRYAYYRCVGTDAYRFADGRVCQNAPVRVDRLDGYVWEAICELLRDPKRLAAEWQRRRSSEGSAAPWRAQRDEAQRQVTHAERSQQRLLDAYEAGVLALEALTARTRRLQARIDRARTELARCEEKLAQREVLASVVGRVEDFARGLKQGLQDLSWEQRRQVIRTLVARVEIDEEGATVVYRVPPPGPSGPSENTPETEASTAPSAPIMPLRGRRDFAHSRQCLPA